MLKLPRDPRLYQITVLLSLLVIGVWRLGFDIAAAQIAVIVATALAVQALAAHVYRTKDLGLRSALISALSLSLLLRTTDWRLAAGASAVAIGSKFLVRIRGKHVFNPTNIALVVMLLASDAAWVSPGQWGSTAFAGFLMGSIGTIVVTRASRADVTLAFLACYVGLLVSRAVWLGDPIVIPIHRLQNGALLLFAFFMISDPKTTPDSRAGRIVFACLVALGGYYVHQVIFRTNGLLWSLAACSLLVPVIDRLLPGPRYAWPGRPASLKESAHETLDVVSRPRARGVLVH